MSGYWRTYIVNEPYRYTSIVNGQQVEQQAVRQVQMREWVDVPDEVPIENEAQEIDHFDSYEAAEDAFEGQLSDAVLVSEQFFEWNDNGDGEVQAHEVGASLAIEGVIGEPLDPERVENAVVAAAMQAVVVPPDADAAEAQRLFDEAAEAARTDLARYQAEGYDLRSAAVLTRADILSRQALAGETEFSENDYLIMYEAAEIRTGVPSEVLRAMGIGESGAGRYLDGQPRHFIDLSEMDPRDAVGQACTLLTPGVDWTYAVFTNGEDFVLSSTPAQDAELLEAGYQIFPVRIGHDFHDHDNNPETPEIVTSLGFGIHQITLPVSVAVQGLETGEPQVWHGRDLRWPGIEVDVERAIRDPVYNIEMAGRLLQWARPRAGFEGDVLPPDGMSGADFYETQDAPLLPWQWGSLVASAQGNLPDSQSIANVEAAMADPSSVPGWSTPEPDLYDAAPEHPTHPDNDEACVNRPPR